MRRPLLVTASLVVTAAGVAGAGVGYAASGSAHPSSVANERYGGLPSYLPASTQRTDGIEVGTIRHPALTSQGDAIVTKLPHGGRVTATVSGPVVPGEGLPFEPEADTATWNVTLSHITRDLPIRLSAFSIVDSEGRVSHPYFVPGARRPPRVLDAGKKTSFALRVVMHTGEGTVNWAPESNDLLAMWDFTLEND